MEGVPVVCFFALESGILRVLSTNIMPPYVSSKGQGQLVRLEAIAEVTKIAFPPSSADSHVKNANFTAKRNMLTVCFKKTV